MAGRRLCWLTSSPAGLPRNGSKRPWSLWRALLGTIPPSAGKSGAPTPVVRHVQTVAAAQLSVLP